MTVFPTKTLLTITTLLCLPMAGAAQLVVNPPSGLVFQPILPNSQSRFGNFDLTTGNAWLGSTLHADASMSRQLQVTVLGSTVNLPMASQHLALNAVANLLGSSREVLDFLGDATNSISSSGQARVGQLRMRLAGNTVINQSSSGNVFGHSGGTFSFNLFPTPPAATVPLVKVWPFGTISVKVEGNVQCTHDSGSMWTMPDGQAEADVALASDLNATASASVSAGISSVTNASVTIQGKLIRSLGVRDNAQASAVSGLVGDVLYQMSPSQIVLSVSAVYMGRQYTQSLTNAAVPVVVEHLF